MKLKLQIDKQEAIKEAKEIVTLLQEIEKKYLFSQLHFADHELNHRDNTVYNGIRAAIQRSVDTVIKLEEQDNEKSVSFFTGLKKVAAL